MSRHHSGASASQPRVGVSGAATLDYVAASFWRFDWRQVDRAGADEAGRPSRCEISTMNSITKYTLSVAGVLLLSGAAMAGEIVEVNSAGQGGPVSFVRDDASAQRVRTTTVGVYRNDRGVGHSRASSQAERNSTFGNTGKIGNGRSVTYWKGQ